MKDTAERPDSETLKLLGTGKEKVVLLNYYIQQLSYKKLCTSDFA